MQMRGWAAVAGTGRYILGETRCRISADAHRLVSLGFFGRGAFECALGRVLSNGHNLMDPRCSHEPAYEEDAATDSEDL
jgi:hypothetical protein